MGRNYSFRPSCRVRFSSSIRLFLENWRGAADPLPFQVYIYFDPVGDLDQRDVAGHAVVFAIEGHCAVDAAGGCSLAARGKSESLPLRDAANGKVALQVECVRTGLNDFRGFERDHGKISHVKKVLAPQFAVFHAAAGVHTVRFDLDV